jgi:hypothetical protein
MSVNIIGDVDVAAGAIKGYFRYQLFASSSTSVNSIQHVFAQSSIHAAVHTLPSVCHVGYVRAASISSPILNPSHAQCRRGCRSTYLPL